MAELDLTNAFNDCVDHLAQGQSLDDCLRRYPQYASSLRPMLEAGLLVQRMHIQPSEVLIAQTRVRRRFEDALRAPPPKRSRAPRRFIYAIAAILIIGFISVVSLSTVSQGSLPGDPLYGVKTFSEGLQRSLFDNDTLETSFNQRRIQEIQQLLALGRSEQVTFNGVITIQNGTNWVIASLPITVQPDVPNAKVAHIGDEVNVTARTSELKTLTALIIQIVDATESPIPTPTINTLVPTVTIPTQTPTPTDTATLSPNPSLTNTPQPSATKLIPTVVPATASITAPTIPQITILTPTECVAVRPNGWVSYQIQSGDTLSALAGGESITLAELMTINCIADARHIVMGETIYLPRMPVISPTTSANTNNNQDSSGSNSGSDNSGSSSPTDDHGGEDNSGHGGSGSSGGGSDDGSGHT